MIEADDQSVRTCGDYIRLPNSSLRQQERDGGIVLENKALYGCTTSSIPYNGKRGRCWDESALLRLLCLIAFSWHTSDEPEV